MNDFKQLKDLKPLIKQLQEMQIQAEAMFNDAIKKVEEKDLTEQEKYYICVAKKAMETKDIFALKDILNGTKS